MILAIDPGKITGLVWDIEGAPSEIDHAMVEFPEIYFTLDEMIKRDRFEYVIIENFLISGQTAKKTQAPWSLKIIGACEYICLREGINMILQTPSEAKNFVTDKRLREHGMWFSGAGHDRDAARHYLLWMYKNKITELRP